MIRRFALFCTLCFFLGLPAVAQTESVGPLTLIRGDARVGRLVRGAMVSLTVSRRLRLLAGDRVYLPPGASAEIVHYPSAKRYGLTAGIATVRADKVVVEGKPPHEATVLARNLGGGLPVAGALTGSARKVLGVLGRGVDDGLFAPEPFGAVGDGDLVLRWKSVPGGKLLLTLTRHGERDPILAETLAAEVTSFSVPAERIEPGQVYLWKVQDITRPQRSLEAPLWRVTEADRRARRELEAAAEALQKTGRAIEADMALADGLFNLGFVAEALDHWRKLAAAEPEVELHRQQVRVLQQKLLLPE